jgi:hypothetical protein
MSVYRIRPPHPELPHGTRNDRVGHTGTVRTPRPSTAPAGLWAPAPEVVVKPKRRANLSQAGNVARMSPCGTETAAKRHQRNGQQCDVCAAAREARKTPRKKAT